MTRFPGWTRATDDEWVYEKPCGECGGEIRGQSNFGQMWAWCDTCTPALPVCHACSKPIDHEGVHDFANDRHWHLACESDLQLPDTIDALRAEVERIRVHVPENFRDLAEYICELQEENERQRLELARARGKVMLHETGHAEAGVSLERDEARRLAEYWRERAMGEWENASFYPLPWEENE